MKDVVNFFKYKDDDYMFVCSGYYFHLWANQDYKLFIVESGIWARNTFMVYVEEGDEIKYQSYVDILKENSILGVNQLLEESLDKMERMSKLVHLS